MKLVRTFFAIALASSVATGCGKSSDLGALEHEANGLVKMYDGKLARLQDRRLSLEARRAKLEGVVVEGMGTANGNFDVATKQLDTLRSRTKSASGELANLAKSPNARTALIAKTGELKSALKDGYTVVNGAFEAYDTYLTRVESRRDSVAAAAPVKTAPTAPPSGDPDAPAAPAGSGSASTPPAAGSAAPAAGSAAPKR